MEYGARGLALAPMTAGLDVVCGKPVGEILAGQTEAHLLNEIRMGQVDITRLTHLLRQPIDQFGCLERTIGGVTDAGYGY